MTFLFWLAVAITISLMAFGCQNYTKKEYYENGQLKSEEIRDGIPNWSSGKTFIVEGT